MEDVRLRNSGILGGGENLDTYERAGNIPGCSCVVVV